MPDDEGVLAVGSDEVLSFLNKIFFYSKQHNAFQHMNDKAPFSDCVF